MGVLLEVRIWSVDWSEYKKLITENQKWDGDDCDENHRRSRSLTDRL